VVGSLPYLSQATWLAIFPGVVIAVVVFALNLLGDGLRDLLDPRTNECCVTDVLRVPPSK